MIKPIMRDIFFLNQKSEPATEADRAVAVDLLDTLKANEAGCVGMAANMIGVKKRIIAVNIGIVQDGSRRSFSMNVTIWKGLLFKCSFLCNQMYKDHIEDRPTGDGGHHLSFPDMKSACDENRDGFRNAVRSLEYIYISKTVDNKHAEYGRGKKISEILNK